MNALGLHIALLPFRWRLRLGWLQIWSGSETNKSGFNIWWLWFGITIKLYNYHTTSNFVNSPSFIKFIIGP